MWQMAFLTMPCDDDDDDDDGGGDVDADGVLMCYVLCSCCLSVFMSPCAVL